MRETLYVIECRDTAGNLDFTGLQPEKIFGVASIAGITEDQMAKVIFRLCPDESIVLTGETIAAWPAHVDARFRARVKTW
jgi:hypothetical protein